MINELVNRTTQQAQAIGGHGGVVAGAIAVSTIVGSPGLRLNM